MLTFPSGNNWLIDCGRQAPDQMSKRGLNWWDVHGQILTHVHGDHAYGMEDLALMRFYGGGPGTGAPIRTGGPKPAFVAHSAVLEETRQFLGPSLRFLTDGSGRNVTDGNLEDYFSIINAAQTEAPRGSSWNFAETFELEGIALRARETQHVPGKPSTSLEIGLEPGGQSIFWWGGDCLLDRDMLEPLEPRTSIFFHDCTFTNQPGQVHAQFVELEKLPESLRKKMVLMHHDDDLDVHAHKALAAGFRLLLPGQVYDLLTGTLIEGPTTVS